MRLIVELDSPAMSEYLVRQKLVRVDRARLNELAIIIKLSQIEEWKEKDRFHKLSLILKSPVMKRTLLMLTSVFLRYFKAECNESK